jgi:hypothetical protein
MIRFLGLSGMAFLILVWSGCGDVFRPIIIPNPPIFPNPRAAHTVLSINDNGPTSRGSVTVVDVSGDSIVSVADMGVAPVHTVQQSASQVLIVNQIVNQALNPPWPYSISKAVFSGTTIPVSNTNPSGISLPAGSAPNFVATTESSQAYVLLPSYSPPSVGVISTTSNALIATAPVGSNPWAMVETADTKKLYVANKGDGTTGTISAFNTIDRSARTISGSFSSAPIWLSARSDSQRVYVLENNGTLASLDTSTSAGPDTLTETGVSVPGATVMVYDGHLNRLYIPGGSEVAIVDVSQPTPRTLATISIGAVQPSSRSAHDPCSTTAVAPLNVTTAAALPDGSRAYFGAYYEDASSGNICPQVTVINTSSNTVKTTAIVPGFANYDTTCATTRFRFAMAAAGDSSRAYLSACDGGNINVIDTSTDTFITALEAPASARPPIPPSTQQPPQNPVFLIAGP